MGVFTFELDVPAAISPAKMFKAFVLDGETFAAKIMPNVIKSVENLHGDGDVGTIRKVVFAGGNGLSYIKEIVVALDKENLTYAYSVIEGDALTDKLEKISHQTKFEATPDGGSICKAKSDYHTLENVEIKEDEVKAIREKMVATFTAIFKSIEAYVLANPEA